jgi:hypothetical protein
MRSRGQKGSYINYGDLRDLETLFIDAHLNIKDFHFLVNMPIEKPKMAQQLLTLVMILLVISIAVNKELLYRFIN